MTWFPDACGSNNTEAAQIDMMNDGVEDLRLKYAKLIYQEYVGFVSVSGNLLWMVKHWIW